MVEETFSFLKARGSRRFAAFSASRGAALIALILVALSLTLPSALAADSIVRTLSLAWDASPSSEVVGYRVRYGTRSGDYPHMIDVGNSTRAEIPNMVNGTTYYFSIVGYTAAGSESPATEELVHTVNTSVLVNISSRAFVRTGDDVMIAGFIVSGSTTKTFVVRALGPSLLADGIVTPLNDPVIDIYANRQLVASNDNWRNQDATALLASGFAPRYDSEAALLIKLAPGAYTAVVRGGNGATGTALLEVYDLGVPEP